MGLWNTIKSVGSKVIGHFANAGKHIGRFGASAAKFAVQNHQLLSAGLQGVSDLMPHNQTLSAVAGIGLLGSAGLTAAGVGRDWLGMRNNPG